MRVLAVVRDCVLIVSAVIVCAVLLLGEQRREHDRIARLVATKAAITELEKAYKAAVFDSSESKGIYQQIFRQNEILLEYVKLGLLRDVLPTDGFDPSALPTPPR
jgi:hypothetical protein